ncbi:MAG: sulfatase-like hydrolase/transferase, partial [Muribaculaceae bacterium]|nr:sulfatase-like hydrolase/transferase [Muribaculaceae bacterium]
YYGREDFESEGLAGGPEEFDGYWAIWDEPFMQYYALKMSQLPQPFMTALFSASSHHPFHVPERYAEVYPEEDGMPIFKTIRYTDNALHRFFETAAKQPWFENTIFVITNDHTNMRAHDEYRSDIGAFYGPVIIYDPSGEIEAGEREGIAQQTDIMPTMLRHVGYKDSYVAFGIDLLNTPAEETWAVSYINDIYQYVRYGLVVQWDGEKIRGVYHLGDHLMADNIMNQLNSEQTDTVNRMETELKAIVQQYMDRMLDDRLTVVQEN